jgi:chromate transporter
MNSQTAEAEAAAPSLAALFRLFFQIGCISFGGAAGQIAMMHRMLVDERRWISEKDYLDGLNFCTLLPGPEAQQLATYIGWRLHGLAGGVIAGVLFVLPGAVLILVLAQAYVLGAGVPAVEALLLGIKAAVIAIILEAVLKFGKRSLKTTPLRLVAVAAFLAMTVFSLPFPIVIIAAALAGLWLEGGKPALPAPEEGAKLRFPLLPAMICLALWWLPVVAAAMLLGTGHFLVETGLFFSKLAVITFGGAYAVLAYLADEAVQRGWVSARQMMDGLGFAETTPGPTILVNPFIAFVAGARESAVMGWLAGLMALWTTFAPSFLWVFVGGPYLSRVIANPKLAAMLRGIGAAVVGIIATVGLKLAVLLVFPASQEITSGPFSMLAPLGMPDWQAFGLAVVALALTFLRHWSILPMVAALAAFSGMIWLIRIGFA